MHGSAQSGCAKPSEEKAEAIRVWRTELLDSVANNLASDGYHRDTQKEIGVWDHGGAMPYPKRRDIKITNAESMTFSVAIANSEVMFSLWVMTGEVRIGVKVPNSLTMITSTRDKIALAYDGKPCHRITQIASDTMYDWIWQDREFATFQHMAQALMNGMGVTIMVDRITQIMVHLYLAVTSILLSSNKLVATHGHVSKHTLELFHIKVEGDIGGLLYRLKIMGGELKEKIDIGRGRTTASILIPEQQVGCFMSGAYLRGQDDDMCEVLEIQKAPFS